MELKPGTVIYWEKFNLPNYKGEIKNVWMVYLGKDSMFDCPICAYCHRFTTQIEKLKNDPHYKSDLTIHFSKGQYSIFDENCILNLREMNYSFEIDYFQSQIIDKTIIIKGKLPEDVIRRIWNLLKKAPHYSKKILNSIRKSLNDYGITGLK